MAVTWLDSIPSNRKKEGEVKVDNPNAGVVEPIVLTQKQLRRNRFSHIAKKQLRDIKLKLKKNAIAQVNDKIDYENNLVENLYMLCKDRRLVIPNKLQESTAISWYHHYLQHPGHTRLQKP